MIPASYHFFIEAIFIICLGGAFFDFFFGLCLVLGFVDVGVGKALHGWSPLSCPD